MRPVARLDSTFWGTWVSRIITWKGDSNFPDMFKTIFSPKTSLQNLQTISFYYWYEFYLIKIKIKFLKLRLSAYACTYLYQNVFRVSYFLKSMGFEIFNMTWTM